MQDTIAENFKKIIKNKYFIIILLTILAFGIRLLQINKPYGFWYDEMITYIFSSSKPYPLSILKALIQEDYHMPLYYLYVGGWMKFFGTSDTILRISSVFWGALCVPAFFLLGKTYKSEKLGYTIAVIACISPIIIYYSQEFRFYSMLICFSALAISFLLKLIDEPKKKSFILFGITNLIILYIYTMGIIFVSLEIFILLLDYYLYKKEHFLKLLKYLGAYFIIAIPYFILLTSYLIADSKSLINPFIWLPLTFKTILFTINDWFGYIFLNIYNPSIDQWVSYNIVAHYLIFLPTMLFSIGFLANLKNLNRKFIYLLFIFLSFFSIELFLCIFRDFILITRYTLIILPAVLLLCLDGILSIKSDLFKKVLLSLILIIYFFNIINYKHSSAFDPRFNGLKPSAEAISQIHITANDYILLPYRSGLFQKYISNAHFIDFDLLGVLSLDKTKTQALKIFNKDFVKSTNRNNAVRKLIPYLLTSNPTPEMENYFNEQINKMPKGSKLIFVNTLTSKISSQKREKFILSNLDNSIEIKKELFGLIYNKIYMDTYNTINTNKNLKKIGKVIDFNKKNSARYWEYIIYQKVK